MSNIALGIGALSRATGIPVNTLRTWERRYGVPASARTEGGQRIYESAEVERIRFIARALEAGHRPARIMQATLTDLRTLVGEPSPEPALIRSSPDDPLLHAVLQLDGPALLDPLRDLLRTAPLIDVLNDHVVPLLHAIGAAWEQGRISPWHEHFASGILTGILTGIWQNCEGAGPLVIVAALPHEQHTLGIHMIAALAARRGWRVRFLGADTPLPDLEAAAWSLRPHALLLSISAAHGTPDTRWNLSALAGRLPPGVELIAGGAGAPRDLNGVRCIASLSGFDQWLEGNSEVQH